MKGIADTGFILAFARSNDRHHRWALNVGKSLAELLLTGEAVLAEAAFHLGDSAFVLALIEDDMLRLSFDSSRHLPQLQELARR